MNRVQAGLLFLIGALWGSSYFLIKVSLLEVSPVTIAFLRCLLGSITLYVFFRCQGKTIKQLVAGCKRASWLAIGAALLSITAPFLLISYGELVVPSGLAAVLICSQPIFVPVFAPLLDHSEKLRRPQAAGLLLGVAGVVLVVGVQSVYSLLSLVAAVGVFFAGVSYAAGSLVVKRVYQDSDPIAGAFYSLLISSILLLPFALLTAPGAMPSINVVWALIGLGVFNTGIAFAIYFKLINEVGAGGATLVGYIQPAAALLWGGLLLGEQITWAAFVGLALIVLGVRLAAPKVAAKVA